MTIAAEEGEDKDADYDDIQWRKSGNQWKGKKLIKRRGKSLMMIGEGGRRERKKRGNKRNEEERN